MLVLLAYCCVVVPYRIPLIYGQTTLDVLTVIDLALSGIFTVDIWLNFNTGRQQQILLERRVGVWRSQGMCTMARWSCSRVQPACTTCATGLSWTSCRPSLGAPRTHTSSRALVPREVFDLTIASVSDDQAMILRLPRLLRLLRVSHAFRYLYRWSELLPVSMYQLRMLKLGFGILLFVHVSASLHLVAGILNRDDPLGWMSRTGALWDSSAHKVRPTTTNPPHGCMRHGVALCTCASMYPGANIKQCSISMRCFERGRMSLPLATGWRRR